MDLTMVDDAFTVLMDTLASLAAGGTFGCEARALGMERNSLGCRRDDVDSEPL